MGGAGSVIAARSSSFVVSASWTFRPESSVNRVAPTAHLSALFNGCYRAGAIEPAARREGKG